MRSCFLGLLLIIYLSVHGQQKQAEKVGFKTFVIYDSSRNFNISPDSFEPRPIVFFAWYPALKSNAAKPMILKELIIHGSLSVFGQQVLAKEENSFKQIAATYPFRNQLNADTLFDAAANAVTLSIENALPSKGKFPVIVFGNGMNAGGYLYYQQCERMARQGYVVMVVASKFQYRDSLPTFNQEGVNAQWQDLYKAVHAIGKEHYADTSRLGIAAWSVGGVSTAILQSKLPQVKAFLALDAGISYAYGKELLTGSQHFNGVSTLPYYELRGAIANQVPRSRYYFDTLATASRCMLTIADLDHYHFTSVANLFQQLSLRDKKKAEAFEFINQVMLHFFDAALKKDNEAAKRLREISSVKNHVTKRECME